MLKPLHTPLKPSAPIDEKHRTQDLPIEEVVGLGHAMLKGLVQPKNLEALRFGIRGNDEAVREIGTVADRQQLNDILAHPGSYTRDDLLEATLANYSGEAYGDNQWIKKRVAWGDSPEVVTAYGYLMESHPEWAQLSLDPGFITHLPYFMDMLDEGEITATDYKDAREQLKVRLGNKIVWRGTMLTDQEFESVHKQGLSSPLSKATHSSEQPLEQFEAVSLSAWPAYTIEAHFHGEHGASPFLSVSEYPEVAISVGRHFGDKTPGKKFYLFKLSIPVIDLVSYADHAYKAPYKLKQLQERNPDFAIKVGVNGKESSHRWDKSVESFVPWKIDAAEIIEVSQPEISDSSWNGMITGSLGT